MVIKKIGIKNFKSFNELEVELNEFNILLGENASGKSNFIEIFSFIKDIVEFGLENAISLHGGIQYISNYNIKSSKNFSINLISDSQINIGFGQKEIILRSNEIDYKFSLKFNENDFSITEESVKIKIEFYKYKKKGEKKKSSHKRKR